jgi:proliferating cell nuclear antigen
MLIRIRQQIIKQAVDIIRHLTNEVKIQVLKDGLYFIVTDPFDYELLIVEIPDFACDDYDLRNTGEINLGVNLDKLRDFLRIFKKDTMFTIVYDQDADRLIIKQGNLTRTMSLIDTDGMPDPKIPKIDLKNKAVVNSKIFYNDLKGVINKNHSEIYLTMLENCIILENHDENNDKSVKAIIDRDMDVYYYDDTTSVFIGDSILKQVNEYKKFSEKLTIETSANTPMKINCSSNELHVEYRLAPIIQDDIKPMIKQEVESEIKNQKIKTEIFETLKPTSEIKETSKPMVIPICKPKHRPYNKFQWSQDMETVKDKIEKHRFNKETEKDLVKKTVKYQGFVFFINVPKSDTVLSYSRIKNMGASEIIQRVLPERYVLIAWYRWNNNGWVAQTVKKAS